MKYVVEYQNLKGEWVKWGTAFTWDIAKKYQMLLKYRKEGRKVRIVPVTKDD